MIKPKKFPKIRKNLPKIFSENPKFLRKSPKTLKICRLEEGVFSKKIFSWGYFGYTPFGHV